MKRIGMEASAVLLLLLILFMLGCKAAVPANEGDAEAELTEVVQTQAASVPTADPYEQAGKSYRSGFRYDTYGAMQFSGLAETDETVYLLSGNILHFSDKAYKDWMPLCARPDCLHDSADCDAYLNTICGIALFDRYIYYVDINTGRHNENIKKPVLCRMRFDGSQHEEVCPLPVPKVSFEPFSNDWTGIFTDKYLIVRYTARRDETMRGGESVSYVLDLETLAHKELVGYNGEVPLYGKGSLLYLLTPGDNGAALGVLDCEACTIEEIGAIEKGFNNTWLQGGFDFTENGFEYLTWDTEADMLRLFTMSLADGKSTLLAEENALDAKWAAFDFTGHYLFSSYFPRLSIEEADRSPDPFGDEPPQYRYEDYHRAEWGFYVWDIGLDLLSSCLYAELPEDGPITVVSQCGDYIFGRSLYSVAPGALPEWYIDKADIGTDGLMWKRWE